ncbi:MAG: type III-B CRISPR-associated protein Cas10/Cmr2 [Brockia lithotrophica]|nr:type III-B CRISPR-associated protein Cas10/Cmr2 [Brockia lithotrophica]
MTAEKTLLVMSFGPVQSWIAAARRTVDLWAGSYILSHLTERAIDALEKEAKKQDIDVEIVFPAVPRHRDIGSAEESVVAAFPNRFSAIVHGAPETAAALARTVEAEVRRRLQALVEEAVDVVFNVGNGPVPEPIQAAKDQAARQAESFLEVYWALEPIPADTVGEDRKPFNAVLDRLESRLAAVKNARPIHPRKEIGLICSVCGEREALHGGDVAVEDSVADLRKKLVALWDKRTGVYRSYGERSDDAAAEEEGRIDEGEFLCGLCLLKRAALDVFQRRSRRDGRVFALKRFPSTDEIAGPAKYYAVLLMDGDDMGKWFSSVQTVDDYRQLSERLARFAQEIVPKIIERHKGTLVYAGGDDVLAFVPAERALSVARELREAFGSDTGFKREATASIGLVVSYYKDPLAQALTKVRAMEKQAKRYVNPSDPSRVKDALGLLLIPHSGDEKSVVLPWKGREGAAIGQAVKSLEELAGFFRRGHWFGFPFCPRCDFARHAASGGGTARGVGPADQK